MEVELITWIIIAIKRIRLLVSMPRRLNVELPRLITLQAPLITSNTPTVALHIHQLISKLRLLDVQPPTELVILTPFVI